MRRVPRIYIEAPLFDTLVSGFEQAVKSLSVGPGMSPEAFINRWCRVRIVTRCRLSSMKRNLATQS